MTTHTKYVLRCQCGHTGYLRMVENDQPFSKQHEKYSLDGFDGDSYYIEDFTTPAYALSQMNATCPKCNISISNENLER
jgi:ribosomal protein S27AE